MDVKSFNINNFNLDGFTSFFSSGDYLVMWGKIWGYYWVRVSLIILLIIFIIACLFIVVKVIYDERVNRE